MSARKTQSVRDAATGGLQIKVTYLYDQWDGTDSCYYDRVRAWEDDTNSEP